MAERRGGRGSGRGRAPHDDRRGAHRRDQPGRAYQAGRAPRQPRRVPGRSVVCERLGLSRAVFAVCQRRADHCVCQPRRERAVHVERGVWQHDRRSGGGVRRRQPAGRRRLRFGMRPRPIGGSSRASRRSRRSRIATCSTSPVTTAFDTFVYVLVGTEWVTTSTPGDRVRVVANERRAPSSSFGPVRTIWERLNGAWLSAAAAPRAQRPGCCERCVTTTPMCVPGADADGDAAVELVVLRSRARLNRA